MVSAMDNEETENNLGIMIFLSNDTIKKRVDELLGSIKNIRRKEYVKVLI